MGFRYRKSIKLAPGVKLNIGSKSVGLSAGVKGARISTNTRTGTRATVSAPGTSLSYSTKLGAPKQRASAVSNNATLDEEPDYSDWYSVTVSARKILWPCLCACCGEDMGAIPGSQPILPNVHAVNMDVATFEPFYCRQCQEHQTKWHEAESMPAVVIPAVNSSVCGVYMCSIILSPCIFGAIFAIFNAITRSGDTAAMLTIVTIVLGIAVFQVNAKKQERQKIADAQAESIRVENQRANLEIEVTQLRKSSCTSLMPTVGIAESHGSKHRFVFVSESLANAFAQINTKKVVY